MKANTQCNILKVILAVVLPLFVVPILVIVGQLFESFVVWEFTLDYKFWLWSSTDRLLLIIFHTVISRLIYVNISVTKEKNNVQTK